MDAYMIQIKLCWNGTGQCRFDIRLRDGTEDGSSNLGGSEMANAVHHSVLFHPVFHPTFPTRRTSLEAGSRGQGNWDNPQGPNRYISLFDLFFSSTFDTWNFSKIRNLQILIFWAPSRLLLRRRLYSVHPTSCLPCSFLPSGMRFLIVHM